MENQLLNLETYILRVHVNCHGCRKKVKKTLTKIEGVYSVNIDAEEQKVTVRGKVDSAKLISKLVKLGKHAELLFPMPNPDRIEGSDHPGNNRRQQMQHHNQLMFPSFHGGESDATEWWLERYKNQLNGEEDWSSETDLSQFEEDHKLHDHRGYHDYYDGSVGVASNRIRRLRYFPGYLHQHYPPSSSPMMPDFLPGYQRYHSNGSYMRTDPYSFQYINNRVPEGNVHQIYPRWGEQNVFSPHASSYRGY